MSRCWVLSIALGLAACLGAMPPPDPGMVTRYQKDGTWAERRAFAQRLGNHRVEPTLVKAAQARLQAALAAKSLGSFVPAVAPTPPSRWVGLPTKGTVKMFVLLVDFSDYPHSESLNPNASVHARVFGDGDAAATAPYESLRNYYRRASHNQLELTGTTLGWYRPAYTRASMATTQAGREALIKEALLSFQAAGHDFAQYDNQNSGAIDYFAVVWSGPDNGWSGFWWGYQTSFGDPNFKVGGKTLRKYSWQWESKPAGGYYTPRTLIHETGHALGLPDYYDYDASVGPNGGVGDLDMMDGNWGDHNCFSKFLLDWITPRLVTDTTLGLTLTPAESSPGDAVIVMPPGTGAGSPFGEYFMLQNRRKLQNDVGYPAEGMLIWHVDSRLDPAIGNADYLFDNSYTAHKLLKLMEADGLEQIETSSASAHAADYFQPGAVFGPTSTPSTLRYEGLLTWLEMRNLGLSGTSLTFDIQAITPDATPPTGAPTQPMGSAKGDALDLTWTRGTALDAESGITGYGIQVGTTPAGNDVFDALQGTATALQLKNLGRFEGRPLYARVRASNGAGLFSGWSPDSAPVVLSLPALDCSVLDNCQLSFKSVGGWTSDPGTFVQGTSSAKSAAIADNASTSLQTWVVGPGTLTFSWKVSSEAGWDWARFLVDGAQGTSPISGEVAWTPVTVSIPAGTHFLQWTYAKDANTIGGSDAAWVDKVLWTGGVPAIVSLDVNGDGVVDLRDLLALAARYGTAHAAADLNADGVVNDLDIAVLLAGL